ncbi:MAG: hypothetical protein FWF20_01500 [Betaproteobacteria bacterium]|nr:hypothetical protein [Betaproteobacteria bacterium]MCL2885457.1 hypothetical protein [Betaproteobacteria bacterium]
MWIIYLLVLAAIPVWFSLMLEKNLSIICAAAFAILGILLASAVPAFNDVYASMYDNWGTSTEFPVRAFHWPFYVWPLLFLMPSIIFYTLGRLLHGTRLRFLNILALVFFTITLAVILDWLTGFTFCHPWGCSGNRAFRFFLRLVS